MSIVRHIAGWASILPLLFSIVAIMTTLWLASSPLHNAWEGVVSALHKESANLSSIPFVRVAHPLVLLFIIPFILLRFLGSYVVWSAALQYVGLVLISVFLGLSMGLVLATPPTLFCIYKLLKERAKQREESLSCT